jgi:hypothetical protein
MEQTFHPMGVLGQIFDGDIYKHENKYGIYFYPLHSFVDQLDSVYDLFSGISVIIDT